MTDLPLPFSRPVELAQVPETGLDIVIEASPAERKALETLLKLPAIEGLKAAFHIKPGRGGRFAVDGAVDALIVQNCVVTLENFSSAVQEPVSIEFAPAHIAAEAAQRAALDPDAPEAPDPIVDGKIDLGAIAAEFLALGLDPYPRKPGAEFDFAGDSTEEDKPFAALAVLKTGKQS